MGSVSRDCCKTSKQTKTLQSKCKEEEDKKGDSQRVMEGKGMRTGLGSDINLQDSDLWQNPRGFWLPRWACPWANNSLQDSKETLEAGRMVNSATKWKFSLTDQKKRAGVQRAESTHIHFRKDCTWVMEELLSPWRPWGRTLDMLPWCSVGMAEVKPIHLYVGMVTQPRAEC